MAELFASGRIIDVILALVALEAIALLAWRARTGRGPAPLPLLCNLASGAALMLAVRAALTGATWTVIAGCLAASLVAHLSELTLRLREPNRHNSRMRAGGTTNDGVAFTGRPVG